jgi:DnaJ like chaperone protein
MTQYRACQLLGVTSNSTQRQIKAAYRRKVSQWHPDRLESRTKEVRLLATEQMAAINEAYRLLRNGLI